MIYSPLNFVDLLGLHRLNPVRYPFLLESQSQLNQRYSFLFTHPEAALILKNLIDFDFLTQLDKQISLQPTSINAILPFSGGYFVYLSYELAAQIERKLNNALIVDNGQIIAYAVRINSAIIIDHKLKKTYFVNKNNDSKIKDIKKDIQWIAKQKNHVAHPIRAKIIDKERQRFIDYIKPIRTYIKQGDIFQANVSRQWCIKLQQQISSADIYQQLRDKNAAPFSALVSFAGFDIISSSPERLFKVADHTIQTRPIAGTYPRAKAQADKKLQNQLLSHPKERAEHIMLVDLERNDLGRICQYGSIEVNELMTLELYPSVQHMVSNIRGRLNANVGFAEIIRAIFPGGTISGCPKIRAMQIIAALEQKSRAAYTGSLGYISDCGRMDFNILIRSLTRNAHNLDLRSGAGIVHDSIAEKEADETEHKAKAILSIFNA